MASETGGGVKKKHEPPRGGYGGGDWLELIEMTDKAVKVKEAPDDEHPLWIDYNNGEFRIGTSHTRRVRTASSLGISRADLAAYLERHEVESYYVPRTYAVPRAQIHRQRKD